jgi:Flp pilus assembly protein CpaB
MKTRIIGIVVASVLAVAGLFVLMVYVGGADSRALANVQLTKVYVVTKAIPAGTPADRIGDAVQTKSIPALGAIKERVRTLDAISGLVSSTKLYPGEQLLMSRWVSPATRSSAVPSLPAGFQALTIALPPERAYGARLQAGDKVGVVVTSGDKVKKNREALQGVTVLSVQSAASAAKSAGAPANVNAGSNLLVTLALTRPGVEAVVWGQQFGAVYLTMQPGAHDNGGKTMTGGVIFP